MYHLLLSGDLDFVYSVDSLLMLSLRLGYSCTGTCTLEISPCATFCVCHFRLVGRAALGQLGRRGETWSLHRGHPPPLDLACSSALDEPRGFAAPYRYAAGIP